MRTANKRVLKLQETIKERGLDAILVFGPANRRYLSGFAGSTGYAVITEDRSDFLVDFRYWEQAAEQCPGWNIVKIMGEADVFAYLREHHIEKLGLEKNFVTIRFSELLLRACDITVVEEIDDVLTKLRMVKDKDELSRIKRACEITDLAFEHILTQIREGMTEAEIDCILQGYMKAYPEVDGMAPRFIVASGEHGALPHGIAGERRIQRGDLITMDFGCNCLGYWSDITRTVCLGKANEKQKEIYAITLKAQEAAIAAVRAGKTGKEIDTVARDVITLAGYGEYFGHGLGHSFGLEIHEVPRCSQNLACDIPLEPGMIMTIEPGIYIPGFGGVRIEDDIVVTKDGCMNLTKAAKELIEL